MDAQLRETLGQRIISATNLAVAEHLYQSLREVSRFKASGSEEDSLNLTAQSRILNSFREVRR